MTEWIDPIDVMIGARIRARREQLGLSQTDLGKVLRVSFQQVQKYENGRNRVAASKIAALSDILKVSNAFFFSHNIGQNVETEGIDITYLNLLAEQTKDARRLLGEFNKIKCNENRRRIILIVRELAEAFQEKDKFQNS